MLLLLAAGGCCCRALEAAAFSLLVEAAVVNCCCKTGTTVLILLEAKSAAEIRSRMLAGLLHGGSILCLLACLGSACGLLLLDWAPLSGLDSPLSIVLLVGGFEWKLSA